MMVVMFEVGRRRMAAADWQALIARWSRAYIRSGSEGAAGVQGAPTGEGLGRSPATDAELAAAESRLGRPLPPSLRAFLGVSNGLTATGGAFGAIAGTSGLAWMR